jgi:hypothetical protein
MLEQLQTIIAVYTDKQYPNGSYPLQMLRSQEQYVQLTMRVNTLLTKFTRQRQVRLDILRHLFDNEDISSAYDLTVTQAQALLAVGYDANEELSSDFTEYILNLMRTWE